MQYKKRFKDKIKICDIKKFKGIKFQYKGFWGNKIWCEVSLVLNWIEFESSTFIDFTFISWEASFKKWMTKLICWFKFFAPSQFGSRIRTEGLNCSSWQKEVAFWCCTVWDYFSLHHSDQIKCCTWSAWFFFLEINFYIKGILICWKISLFIQMKRSSFIS